MIELRSCASQGFLRLVTPRTRMVRSLWSGGPVTGAAGAVGDRYLVRSPAARQCAARGGGVGRRGPTSHRVGFGAQPRLQDDAPHDIDHARTA